MFQKRFNPFMPSSMPSNPFMGNPSSTPFMGGNALGNSGGMFSSPAQKPISSLTNDEIDQMIADIDKKLKELDEEEAREKEKLAKQNQIELPKLETPKPSESIEKNLEMPMPKIEEKPKINVDADSIVMDDNIITDDEFFDDFFHDDE